MNQLNLFDSGKEKGGGEWKLAQAVREDRPGMFRVLTPTTRDPQRGTVVPIRRYREARPFTPQRA